MRDGARCLGGCRPKTAANPGRHRGGAPAWFSASFKEFAGSEPLFLRLATGKGQIFLNGHNIGRYWGIGPQQHYYLPSCWLGAKNELVIFDETGLAPTKTARWSCCRHGPYEKAT